MRVKCGNTVLDKIWSLPCRNSYSNLLTPPGFDLTAAVTRIPKSPSHFYPLPPPISKISKNTYNNEGPFTLFTAVITHGPPVGLSHHPEFRAELALQLALVPDHRGVGSG